MFRSKKRLDTPSYRNPFLLVNLRQFFVRKNHVLEVLRIVRTTFSGQFFIVPLSLLLVSVTTRDTHHTRFLLWFSCFCWKKVHQITFTVVHLTQILMMLGLGVTTLFYTQKSAGLWSWVMWGCFVAWNAYIFQENLHIKLLIYHKT